MLVYAVLPSKSGFVAQDLAAQPFYPINADRRLGSRDFIGDNRKISLLMLKVLLVRKGTLKCNSNRE
jgi:hypothetical protein